MINKQKFKGKILFRKTLVNRILATYNNTQVTGSSDWYREANKLAYSLSQKYNYTPLQVAGVISALSPLKSWDENKRITESFLRNGAGKHTKMMLDKAKDILNYNDNFQREFILVTLNGNKISNFFLNIAYPKQAISVTIDRHAIAVCLNRPINENEGTSITNQQYEFFASCYRQASKEVGILPNEMQAITWVKWRKLKTLKQNQDVPF